MPFLHKTLIHTKIGIRSEVSLVLAYSNLFAISIQLALCMEGGVHRCTMKRPIWTHITRIDITGSDLRAARDLSMELLDAGGLNLFEVIGETVKEANHLT